MDFLELAKKRYSVRKYKDQPVVVVVYTNEEGTVTFA